jgi:hypothetical protein
MNHLAPDRTPVVALLVMMAGFAICTPGGANAESASPLSTVSGRAYEGQHLAPVDSSTPLYTLSVTTQKGAGVDRIQIIDVDRNGRSFFTQTIDFDGASPKSYAFSNSVARQAGKLIVTPTELVMELTERGETKVAREARPALFAVGPSITRLVEQHVDDFSAGRAVMFRMVVVNRLETYGFRAVSEPSSSDEPIPQVKAGQWMRVRVEPDGGMARMFAPKVVLIIDAKTGQTFAVNGPIPSPGSDGGMIKNGTIRYEGFR